jgi:anti-sigma factor RsiW
MNCEKAIKDKVMALALGELSPAEALQAEKHIAGCASCAALRLALLEERAALGAAGAPLLPAGAGLADSVMAAVHGYDVRRRRAAAAALVFAAGFAALMLFMPGGRPGAALPPASSINPFYAANLGGGGATADALMGGPEARPLPLFFELSCRGAYAAEAGIPAK